MPSDSFEQLLDRAAFLFGIDSGFWDIWGNYHTTSTAGKQAILRALGVNSDNAATLQQALTEIARLQWERLLPPAVVVGQTGTVDLPLYIPSECLGQTARFVVRPEGGEPVEFQVNLWDLPQSGSVEMDGHTWMCRQVALPLDLPLGYHEVSAVVGVRKGATRYIVTPDRAWMDPHLGRGGRAAGIAVSLYGARSERNWGCGDFRDLREIID